MLRDRLAEYVRNTAVIRALSNPDPAQLASEEVYSEVLRTNFIQIGKLAQRNRAILSDVLDPLLAGSTELSPEDIGELNRFSGKLLNMSSIDSLDIPLSYVISLRLLKYAEEGDDAEQILRQADYLLSASYAMLNLTKRFSFGIRVHEEYRKIGYHAASLLKPWCRKEKLEEIGDTVLRELIVADSRFMTCLYEGIPDDPECCRKHMDELDRSMDLMQKPEIRALVPDYDWDYHIFRIMEYMSLIPEHNNLRGSTLKQRRRINDVSRLLLKRWDSDPEHYRCFSPRVIAQLAVLRSTFLSGRMERDDYLDALAKLYRDCEDQSARDSSVKEVHYILDIPLEYIYALERPSGYVTKETDHPTAGGAAEPLTPEQVQNLTRFYRMIEKRALHAADRYSLPFLLEFLSMLLLHFIEVPEISYMEFCLTVMGNLHPPTYVHSRMVGEISECLCRHLIRREPEMLIGLHGYADAGQVLEHEEEISAFIRNAALCHDFGKIPMIDIIFVYGRKLFDFEFDLIRHHPDLGMIMISRIPSMRSCLDIVRGHHKWYDDSAGYPPGFFMEESPQQVLIDLVTCADCMDAATDVIGRSYSRGKTLDEYIAEVAEGSGTRYAPFLADMLRETDVHADMERILRERREEYYRSAYRMLVEKEE